MVSCRHLMPRRRVRAMVLAAIVLWLVADVDIFRQWTQESFEDAERTETLDLAAVEFDAIEHTTVASTGHTLAQSDIKQAEMAAAACTAATAAAGTIPAALPEPAGPGLRHIIHFNVLNGVWDRARRQRLCRWLAQQAADVVTMNEANFWEARDLQIWGRRCGYAHAAVLHTNSPYWLGVLSREEPIVVRGEYLRGFAHGLLHAEIGGWHYFITHLTPHGGQEGWLEASHLLSVINASVGLWDAPAGTGWALPQPAIVLGDLNCLSRLDMALYEAESLASTLDKTKIDTGRSKHGLAAKFLTSAGQVNYATADMLLEAGLQDVRPLLELGAPPWPRPPDAKVIDPSGWSDYTVPTSYKADAMHAAPMRLDYALLTPAATASMLCPGCAAHAGSVQTMISSQLSDHYPLEVLLCAPNSEQQTKTTQTAADRDRNLHSCTARIRRRLARRFSTEAQLECEAKEWANAEVARLQSAQQAAQLAIAAGKERAAADAAVAARKIVHTPEAIAGLAGESCAAACKRTGRERALERYAKPEWAWLNWPIPPPLPNSDSMDDRNGFTELRKAMNAAITASFVEHKSKYASVSAQQGARSALIRVPLPASHRTSSTSDTLANGSHYVSLFGHKILLPPDGEGFPTEMEDGASTVSIDNMAGCGTLDNPCRHRRTQNHLQEVLFGGNDGHFPGRAKQQQTQDDVELLLEKASLPSSGVDPSVSPVLARADNHVENIEEAYHSATNQLKDQLLEQGMESASKLLAIVDSDNGDADTQLDQVLALLHKAAPPQGRLPPAAIEQLQQWTARLVLDRGLLPDGFTAPPWRCDPEKTANVGCEHLVAMFTCQNGCFEPPAGYPTRGEEAPSWSDWSGDMLPRVCLTRRPKPVQHRSSGPPISGCRYTAAQNNTFIGGCVNGCRAFQTLLSALDSCSQNDNCGGVTKSDDQGQRGFQLRAGSAAVAAPEIAGETSWIKTECATGKGGALDMCQIRDTLGHAHRLCMCVEI